MSHDLAIESCPDGSAVYHMADGYVCAWTFAGARIAKMHFETPAAARLSWELTKPDPLGPFMFETSIRYGYTTSGPVDFFGGTNG